MFAMMIIFILLSSQVYLCMANLGCGADVPSQAAQVLDQALMERLNRASEGRKLVLKSCEELCDQCITVDVYIHFHVFRLDDGTEVVPHPEVSVFEYKNGNRDITEANFTSLEDMLATIDGQMTFLNDKFSGSPFRFDFKNRDSVTLICNDDWVDYPIDYSNEMTLQYNMGNATTLNLYLLSTLTSRTGIGVLVGRATFPSYQNQRDGDAIFMRYDTLPEGGLPGYGTGVTLVHEVGHWLGLYHTFQNQAELNDEVLDGPCSSSNQNDFVDDTPAMAAASNSFDCLSFLDSDNIPDTCPDSPGLDPVFNWMGYVSDEICLIDKGEFTCGQKERMYSQWLLYREHVAQCNENEIQVDLLITLDSSVHSDENSFFLFSTSGEALLDSNRDHEDSQTGIRQDIVAIDLCVPADEYEFKYLDSFGDGLGAGSIELLLDRTVYCLFDNDFDSETSATFNNEGFIDCPGTLTDSAQTSEGLNPIDIGPPPVPESAPTPTAGTLAPVDTVVPPVPEVVPAPTGSPPVTMNPPATETMETSQPQSSDTNEDSPTASGNDSSLASIVGLVVMTMM